MNNDKKFSFMEASVENGMATLRKTKPVWQFVSAMNMNGFNIVRFSRKLTVCANAKYINIDSGSSLCLYGFGSQPELDTNNLMSSYSSVFKYSMPVGFLGALNEKVDLTKILDLQTYEFRASVAIPSDAVTSYFCNMFKLPEEWMNKKKHLVRVCLKSFLVLYII